MGELSREEGRGTGFCLSKSKSCSGNLSRGSVKERRVGYLNGPFNVWPRNTWSKKGRCMGFAMIIVLAFLKISYNFILERQTKVSLGYQDKETINHHHSQISLGAIWANAWRFQGKTELQRSGAPKSRIAKNRHGLIFTSTPGNDSSEC